MWNLKISNQAGTFLKHRLQFEWLRINHWNSNENEFVSWIIRKQAIKSFTLWSNLEKKKNLRKTYYSSWLTRTIKNEEIHPWQCYPHRQKYFTIHSKFEINPHTTTQKSTLLTKVVINVLIIRWNFLHNHFTSITIDIYTFSDNILIKFVSKKFFFFFFILAALLLADIMFT